ncbi:MAG: (Fe-S)-binding protein [Nitrospinota bacterium]|nr:MAG: (Fe-S)-binding protein [Nitrospinota bacterium]
MAEKGEADILFWVGCSGALFDRNVRTTIALAKILQRAGVDFAILGEEETCSGDPARRLGNEYLFQMLAQQNIETLNRYKFRRIVTHCPHCFNTLKNEYPQFGGHYEVIHHSQLIAELLQSGRLKPTKPLSGKITYHDSCYLGRYNGIYDAPRDILRAIPGSHLLEMKRSRERGLCCGAGGGHAWMEVRQGRPVNHIRTEEVMSVGAEMVGTACPFCMQMMEDGIRAKQQEETIAALDIAEIVERALE